MSLADPRTHTDAVVAALVAAGLVVGDGGSPPDPFGWAGTPGQSQFHAYAIVYPLGQVFDGTLGCPDVDSDLRWQVTCVGASREQAEWVQHQTQTALIGAVLTVAGRSVPRVRPDGGAGVRRDDTTQPPLFLSTPRFAAQSH